MEKISKFTFYYVTPIVLGLITGLSVRDSLGLNMNRKISMSLADYYEKIDEDIDPAIGKEFPNVENFLKKVKKK